MHVCGANVACTSAKWSRLIWGAGCFHGKLELLGGGVCQEWLDFGCIPASHKSKAWALNGPWETCAWLLGLQRGWHWHPPSAVHVCGAAACCPASSHPLPRYIAQAFASAHACMHVRVCANS